MLVQIYETSSAEEATALSRMGVDHIGVLVGNSTYPREQSIEAGKHILRAVLPPSKGSVLCLSADIGLIEHIIVSLEPAILHLGASIELLMPEHVCRLKKQFDWIVVQRSIPVVDDTSVSLAQSYETADMLLLDSHRPGDTQIGALGVTHSWELDRNIVEYVKMPVIIAGGLGPDNVADANRATAPAGVDSKDKDRQGRWQSHEGLGKVRQFVSLVKSLDGGEGS